MSDQDAASMNNNIYIPNSSDSKIVDSSHEQNLRRSIISINNNASYTSAEKAKMIQVYIRFT